MLENTSINIHSLADTLGVSRSLLRFWEEEFDLEWRDNESLTALETAEIYTIFDLIDTKGLSLAEAKAAFIIEKQRLVAKYTALEKLISIRESLVKWRDEIDIDVIKM